MGWAMFALTVLNVALLAANRVFSRKASRRLRQAEERNLRADAMYRTLREEGARWAERSRRREEELVKREAELRGGPRWN